MKNILSYNNKPILGKDIKDWIKYQIKHEAHYSAIAKRMEKYMNIHDDVLYHVIPSRPSTACGQIEKNRPVIIRQCYFRENKMIAPLDAWYWNPYENDQIKISVSFQEYDDKQCVVKIMAWGCDDFGVEQEFVSNDYSEAYQKYEFWKDGLYNEIQDGVNYEWFIKKGFYRV